MNDRGDLARPDDVSRDPAPFGNVGQHDPHADPVTQPALPRPATPRTAVDDEKTVDLRPEPLPQPLPQSQPLPQPTTESRPQPASAREQDRTVFSGLYVGLVLAALVLVFLLVFILQNDAPVDITFLWMTGRLPSGVALLLAAIAGVLLVAIPGSGRIIQLRRAARRTARQR